MGAENPDALTQDERVQFGFMLLSVFRAYETSFYQHRVGTLDEELYQAIMRDAGVMLGAPGVHGWWAETPFSFSPEFRRHLEAHVRRPQS